MSSPRPLRTEIEVWVVGFRLTAASQFGPVAGTSFRNQPLGADKEARPLVTRQLPFAS